MVEKPKPRDIRAFFAGFSKPTKRSATEKPDVEIQRSKSPRVSIDPRQSVGQDSKQRQRVIIDLSSSNSQDSEEEDEEPIEEEETTPQNERQSFSLPAPGASFTSMQSNRSQAPSSQRIVKNGEVMVTNSDEEDDSGSAVEDLDELLGLFKPKETTKLMPQPTSSDPSEEDTIHVRPQLRTLPPLERGLKRHFRVDHSVKSRRLLHDLVAKTSRERAVAEGRREAMTAIDESNTRVQELEAKISDADVSTSIDPTMLASMIGENTEASEYDKLVQALKRTEALQSRLEWSFFGDQMPDLNLDARPPKNLKKWFGQRQYVEAAMISGFLDDLIAAGDIQADEENLQWTLVAALTSPRDDLHTTYSQLLAQENGEKYLDEDWVWRLFYLMGAAWEALDEAVPVKPQIRLGAPPERDPRNWPRVLRLLNILKSISTKLPRKTRRRAFGMLCRLALDVEVSAHHAARIATQETINEVLDAIPTSTAEEEMSILIEDLSHQVPNARMRINLLHAFLGPAHRTFLFRRKAALALFLESRDDTLEQDETDLLTLVTTHLTTHPGFQISADVDFSWLAATIEALDIAVGDGRENVISTSDDTAAATRDFNRRVDQLADYVKSMATQIRDSGANHLSRTEAKEGLDAMHARLLYAVRTEPRPKRSIFGDSTGETNMAGASMMKQWIKRGKMDQKGVEVD